MKSAIAHPSWFNDPARFDKEHAEVNWNMFILLSRKLIIFDTCSWNRWVCLIISPMSSTSSGGSSKGGGRNWGCNPTSMMDGRCQHWPWMLSSHHHLMPYVRSSHVNCNIDIDSRYLYPFSLSGWDPATAFLWTASPWCRIIWSNRLDRKHPLSSPVFWGR